MDTSTRPGPTRTGDDHLLLRVSAAARRLEISRSHAYALARIGALPGVVRLGRSIRVSVRGIEEWIEQERQGSAKPFRGRRNPMSPCHRLASGKPFPGMDALVREGLRSWLGAAPSLAYERSQSTKALDRCR